MAPMLASAVILLLLVSGYFELPSISSYSAAPAPALFATALDAVGTRERSPFTSLLSAFADWDAAVGARASAKLDAVGPPGYRRQLDPAAAASITGGPGGAAAAAAEVRGREDAPRRGARQGVDVDPRRARRGVHLPVRGELRVEQVRRRRRPARRAALRGRHAAAAGSHWGSHFAGSFL